LSRVAEKAKQKRNHRFNAQTRGGGEDGMEIRVRWADGGLNEISLQHKSDPIAAKTREGKTKSYQKLIKRTRGVLRDIVRSKIGKEKKNGSWIMKRGGRGAVR